MAEKDAEYLPRSSSEFVESSILDTIIPQATNFDIEEALNGSVERLDDSTASPLSSIAQRNFLFFGLCSYEFHCFNVLLIPRSQMRNSMFMLYSKPHTAMSGH